MTDAVLEVVVDASAAIAGARETVRALDDIRAHAEAAEGALGTIGRGLDAGGRAIARSLDDASRRLVDVERAAARAFDTGGVAAWGDGIDDALGSIGRTVDGLFDRIGTAIGGAGRGLLDGLGRIGRGIASLFGGGGGLDAGGIASTVLRGGIGVAGSLFPSSLGFLGGPLGALAGGLVGSLLAGLFKQKPSNKGAEFSFATDAAFTTAFEGTKHAEQRAGVKAFADDLQTAIARAERLFGVARRGDAAAGATFGRKEGSAFFYDAGPRDGGIEGRAVFGFDPEKPEEIQAALDGFLVAFVKDADWSGLGGRVGEDVATALANSAAGTIEAVLADVDFAAAFGDLAELGSGALDPVALGLRALEESGRAAADAIVRAGDDFAERARALGLGSETLADGMTRADAATRGYVRALIGIEAPLGPLAAAAAEAGAFVDRLGPALERLGFSAAEVAEMTDQASRRMTRAARQDLAQAGLGVRGAVEAAIDPAWRPSARAVLEGQGLDPALYARLLGLVERAASGDAEALRQAGERLIANIEAGHLGRGQADAVLNFATEGFGRAVSAGIAGRPANPGDPGGVERAARETEIRALRDQADAIEKSARVHRDAAAAAERLGDQLSGTAEGLRRERLGLLTDPGVSPYSLADQLTAARDQRRAAAARVAAGGEGAGEAARELAEANRRVNELARLVFGSSAQSVAAFEEGLRLIEGGEDATRSLGERQLAIAREQSRLLGEANAELDRIRDAIAAGVGSGSAADTGRPANPGVGGGFGDGNPPPPGYHAGADGSLVRATFGLAHLDRAPNESADAFLRRRFPGLAAGAAEGTIGEAAGHALLQAPHASGLGLTVNAYAAAATRAGFHGRFTEGGHAAWLQGDPTQGRFRAFIDALREQTEVPYGFFGVPYAAGGLVPHVPGVTRPGADSFPALLMPGERVFSEPHSRIIEGLAAANGDTPAALRDLGGAMRETGAAGLAEARLLRAEVAALRAETAALRADLRLALAGPAVGRAGGMR